MFWHIDIRLHYVAILLGAITKTVWLILLKFCIMARISPPEITICLKNQTFKNLSWQMAAILKIDKRDISATI